LGYQTCGIGSSSDNSALPSENFFSFLIPFVLPLYYLQYIGTELQGGSNMTGTDLCVNKPHCAAAVPP